MTMRSADECEMSRSCQRATFSNPASAAARTTRARPQMRSAVTGCACGASPTSPSGRDRTAPRPRGPPFARGAGSRARTCRATTRARASAASSSAWRSRWRICVETGAGSSPSALARDPLDVRVGGCVRADGAGELSDPQLLERSREAAAAAVELERPAGELEAERRRLGVDAVGAADLERSAVLLGPPGHGGEARRRSLPRSSAPASRIWSESAVSITSDEVSP